MSARDASPLESFHQFIGDQLRCHPTPTISPEQAVALWREREGTIEAVREGLRDVEAGRVKPVDEFLRDFTIRHRIIDNRIVDNG